jgi:hypothetical protein
MLCHGAAYTHTATAAPTLSNFDTPLLGYRRELCREAEARRDPDNLNRLASSSAIRHTPDQEDMSLSPQQDRKSLWTGLLLYSSIFSKF